MIEALKTIYFVTMGTWKDTVTIYKFLVKENEKGYSIRESERLCGDRVWERNYIHKSNGGVFDNYKEALQFALKWSHHDYTRFTRRAKITRENYHELIELGKEFNLVRTIGIGPDGNRSYEFMPFVTDEK